VSSGPERIRLPVSGGSLDADRWPGTRGGAVVAPPHPEYGGERDNWVVRCLVQALVASGRTVVAFDWRGVGTSDGRPTGDPNAAIEDYAAAVAALPSGARPTWVAAGYSFGAATALRIAASDPAAGGLLLIAPPVAMTGTADLEACTKPLGVVVGDGDTIAPPSVLRRALQAISTARLEVLTGVDHFFGGASPHALAEALGTALGAIDA